MVTHARDVIDGVRKEPSTHLRFVPSGVRSVPLTKRVTRAHNKWAVDFVRIYIFFVHLLVG